MNDTLQDMADSARKLLTTNRGNYKRTFESESGQAVLKELLQFTQYHIDSFVPDDQGGARKEAYLLGQRRVMLHIFGILKMEEEQIIELSKRRDL